LRNEAGGASTRRATGCSIFPRAARIGSYSLFLPKQPMNARSKPDLLDHLNNIGRRHSLEHEGRVTSWREFGAGTPVVLVHGGHGSWLHWASNIEALSASHRVLVPDLPCYGESDALPEHGGFPAIVESMARSVDQLVGPGASINLAGFSFGGVVAGQLALLRGGVRKLALLGAVGHGRRRRPTAPLVGWQDAPDQQTMLAALRHNLSALMLHGPVDALALEIHHYSCLRTRYHSKRTSLSPLLTTTLEQLDMPVLMLWGEHDPTGDPAEVGPLWQACRPERQFEIIPGAGHWVQYEAADEVNDRLAGWFTS
jgi:pimeloyl-ACP methyl ester carboxylesterase